MNDKELGGLVDAYLYHLWGAQRGDDLPEKFSLLTSAQLAKVRAEAARQREEVEDKSREFAPETFKKRRG